MSLIKTRTYVKAQRQWLVLVYVAVLITVLVFLAVNA